MLGGVDIDLSRLAQDFPGHRINHQDALHLIPEEGDPVGDLVLVSREDLQRIAAHAEHAGLLLHVVALVLAVDQLAQERIPPVDLPHLELDDHLVVSGRVTQTVDTRN